ncbi:hypothetical protein B0H14DRAFT_3046254, partial [Mycena olivaceomarginata]
IADALLRWTRHCVLCLRYAWYASIACELLLFFVGQSLLDCSLHAQFANHSACHLWCVTNSGELTELRAFVSFALVHSSIILI